MKGILFQAVSRAALSNGAGEWLRSLSLSLFSLSSSSSSLSSSLSAAPFHTFWSVCVSRACVSSECCTPRSRGHRRSLRSTHSYEQTLTHVHSCTHHDTLTLTHVPTTTHTHTHSHIYTNAKTYTAHTQTQTQTRNTNTHTHRHRHNPTHLSRNC